MTKPTIPAMENSIPYFPPKKSGEKGVLDNIFKQRASQRNFLFWFSIALVLFCSIGLFYLIGSIIHYRIEKNIEILKPWELQVLSVAIIAQAYGIVKIITVSLWNDTPYKEILQNLDSSKK